MGQSHWGHCEKDELPSPPEEVQPVTGAADTVLLCHHWIRPLHINNCSGSAQLPNLTSEDYGGSAERIIGTTLPTLQDLYLSRLSKMAGKITLDPSHQHTPSLNCYRLVNATELWEPEIVSFPKQSISWTLDIKHGTHNIIIQLFNHHTHWFFSFQICTCQTSHITVCIV